MTEYELFEMIGKLEGAFGTQIKPAMRQVWQKRFFDLDIEDFRKVVDHVITTRKFFPRVATIYEAMKELGISGKRKKSKIVWPITIYKNVETGATLVHCNETGRDNDPPDEIQAFSFRYKFLFRHKPEDFIIPDEEIAESVRQANLRRVRKAKEKLKESVAVPEVKEWQVKAEEDKWK